MNADEESCTTTRTDAAIIDRKDKIGNHEISMESAVTELLHNIGSTTTNPSCVPRKLQLFVNYCNRNTKRLLPSFQLHIKAASLKKEGQVEPTPKRQKCDKSSGNNESSLMRSIAEASYVKIQQKQRPLMNLPKPTEDWESALGQLRLLGFGDHNHFACADTNERSKRQNRGVEDHHCQTSDSKLHIVHRLDCQVSQYYYSNETLCILLVHGAPLSINTTFKINQNADVWCHGYCKEQRIELKALPGMERTAVGEENILSARIGLASIPSAGS